MGLGEAYEMEKMLGINHGKRRDGVPAPNVVVGITRGPGHPEAFDRVIEALEREQIPKSHRYLQTGPAPFSCFRNLALTTERMPGIGEVTHVIRLSGDTPPHPGFGLLVPWLARLDLARPGPIDLVVNTDHPEISALGQLTSAPTLYVSADGGGTGITLWPIALLRAYLDWRDRWLPDDIADNHGMNLWSIAEDVPIYTPVRSLVGRVDTRPPLLDPRDTSPPPRDPLHPMTLAVAESWAATDPGRVGCVRIGRILPNIQRELFYRRRGFREARARAALHHAGDEMMRALGDVAYCLPITGMLADLDEHQFGEDPAEHRFGDLAEGPERFEYLTPALIERVYAVERDGAPVDPMGVAIACPSYRGLKSETALAMNIAEAHLRKAGYHVSYILTPGASLVTRARHRIQHLFMQSDCSYLLSWDDDVVPLDPSVVVRMVKTGHPIVAGAYPLRGRDAQAVAANPLVTADGQPMINVKEDGTTTVRDAATGFLLVKREVFADLMARHPERLYIDTAHGEFRYAPMWDLFSTFVDPGEPPGSKGAKEDPQAYGWPTYRSEDYGFCSLARAAGYAVRVLLDARFDHHGEGVYRGSAAEAWLPKATRVGGER